MLFKPGPRLGPLLTQVNETFPKDGAVVLLREMRTHYLNGEGSLEGDAADALRAKMMPSMEALSLSKIQTEILEDLQALQALQAHQDPSSTEKSMTYFVDLDGFWILKTFIFVGSYIRTCAELEKAVFQTILETIWDDVISSLARSSDSFSKSFSALLLDSRLLDSVPVPQAPRAPRALDTDMAYAFDILMQIVTQM